MKTKHIIASASAAIIAGSIFYYPARRKHDAVPDLTPEKPEKSNEERIREVMHKPKEH